MATTKKGKAIPAERRRPEDIAELEQVRADARRTKKRDLVQRIDALLGYIEGKSVISMAEALKVGRATINKWLRWYATAGVEGLFTRKSTGAPPRMTHEQRAELFTLIEAGPIAAGYTSGVWTGPMIGDLIRQKYDVSYHNHYIPRLLGKLHLSVQRPRKRLARADAEAQQHWLDERLPEIKKSQ